MGRKGYAIAERDENDATPREDLPDHSGQEVRDVTCVKRALLMDYRHHNRTLVWGQEIDFGQLSLRRSGEKK